MPIHAEEPLNFYGLNIGATKSSEVKLLHPELTCDDLIHPGSGGLTCHFHLPAQTPWRDITLTFDNYGILQYAFVMYDLTNPYDFKAASDLFVMYFGNSAVNIKGIDRVRKLNDGVIEYQSSFNPNLGAFEITSTQFYRKIHSPGYGRN